MRCTFFFFFLPNLALLCTLIHLQAKLFQEFAYLLNEIVKHHFLSQVSWLKDGEPLEINNLTHAALTVSVASIEDGGEYVCVAENEAAKRLSAPILVEVLREFF